MLNTEMVIGIVVVIGLAITAVGAMEFIDKRRGLRHHDSNPKFRVSSAPKPELENTVKVRGRRASDRPVIRATQMRGKARRKF